MSNEEAPGPGDPTPEQRAEAAEKMQAYKEAIAKQTAEGLMRMRVAIEAGKGPAGETLWVKPLGVAWGSDGYTNVNMLVSVRNVGMWADLGIDDIVEAALPKDEGSILDFVKVVDKRSTTMPVQYKFEGDPKPVYAELYDHFAKHGMRVEGWAPGVLSLCIPEWMTDKYIEHAFATAPQMINPSSYIDRDKAKPWE